MSYRVELSDRARRDFSRPDRNLQRRIGARIDELAHNPRDSRIFGTLTNAGDLRKSRVGGWRIIFTIDDANRVVYLVTNRAARSGVPEAVTGQLAME